MEYIFCGSCLPDIYETEVKYLSAAGNKLQNSVINMIKKDTKVVILSYLSFPLFNKFVTKDVHIEIDDYNIYIKDNSLLKSLLSFRKRLKEEIRQRDVIIAYNVSYPWYGVGKITKKYNKKSILILADYTPPHEESGILRKIAAHVAKFNFRQYSRVILLSENLKEYLTQEQEYMVVPGGINFSNYDDFNIKSLNRENIVIQYSGVLSEITGVDLLMKTIAQISLENIEIRFTGKGEFAEDLIELSKKDKRVKYYGFVNKHEYYNLLKDADILINPRNMHLSQNQYNFPSKIIEYLATGRVIISTKFPGYEKFKNNITFFQSDVSSLVKGIESTVQNMSTHLIEKNYESNRMLAAEFDWLYQIRKILN